MEIYNQVNRNTSIIQKLLRKVYPTKYNNKEAIIVIRHSIDDDNNRPINDEDNTYTLPNSQIITPYYENSLTPEGKCASENYVIILNKIISDLGLSTINRVVIKDPEIQEKSSNTFFTALPFINNNKIQDVRLRTSIEDESGNEILDLEDDDLITKNGSILVCWSQETLWSEKDENDDRKEQPDDTSILGILNNTYNISCNIQGPPRKGVTIYIYLEDTVLHIYSMLTNPLRYEVGYKKNF